MKPTDFQSKMWCFITVVKTFQAKSVDAILGAINSHPFILQFEKLTAFEDCTLSFSLNGEPVSLDIQSCLADRK